jgi:NADH dehydrogenase
LVFGRGDNPVNFVSVKDVAALVDHVVTDTSTRGSVYEIGGPRT